MEFVGKTVRKEFKGFGVFTGVVKSYDESNGFFEILYEDGDSEELEFSEVVSLFEGLIVDQSGTGDLCNKPTRVGRKPKKRRRFEISGDSGTNSANLLSTSSVKESFDEIHTKDGVSKQGLSETGFSQTLKENVLDHGNVNTGGRIDLNSNDGLNLNDGLNSNEGSNVHDGFDLNCNYKENLERSSCIDLNLDLNGDYDDNLKSCDSGVPFVATQKRELSFDLNLVLDADCNGQPKENNSFHILEEFEKKETVFEVSEVSKVKDTNGSSDNVLEDSRLSSVELVERIPGENSLSSGGLTETKYLKDCLSFDVHLKEGLSSAGTSVTHGYQEYSRNTYKGKNRRKRRKVSDNVDSAAETVLRRSSRRVTATFSAPNHVSSTILFANDPSSSPAISAVSEEKTLLPWCEESEEQIVLPPKLQLPSSSENLNLDGIPVLDLFSVYACLRSFSTSLYLSPFELGDLVAAVKCKAPNLLFDYIHVSLLQTLRKHLEFLSDESSQSASNCLRSLNWDILDLITWPIFMAEYLLMHSSGLKPMFDLCRLKVIETDYYNQPESVKIEILRCLCDDVIEVEAVRSELNKRTLAVEPNIDSDRNVKIDISNKRRVQMDETPFTEEVVDETTDWNSDECCLCKMDGSLICCDGCPAAFHSRCVGVASSLLPEGDWYCPECVIDKDKPWMKLGKSLRGAELLGIDPHGQLYYSSCGYLLVSDSCDTESSFNYYNKNDLPPVIEALKSSDIGYSAILSSILKHWDLSIDFNGVKSDTLAPSETCVKDEAIDERKPEQNSMVSELVSIEPAGVNHFVKTENLLTSSEGLVDKSQAIMGIPNFQKAKLGRLKRSYDTRDNGYVNFYTFARTASSVLEELTRKSSEKTVKDSMKSVEDIISAQVKAICKKYTKFSWPNIKKLSIDARREKCGWCFSCRVPDDYIYRDCLFNMNVAGPALEGSTTELVGPRSKRNRRGHLIDVMCYILTIEERLHGLLLGPWLNPHYTKHWRKSFLKASDIASVKHLFLMLESNLRHLALSAEWLKHVDSVATMGSSSHMVKSTVRVSSKHGISKKRARFSDPEPNTSSGAASGLGLFWWRGGRLSRQLFNWKVLPRSLASKAARQGGYFKIQGVLYPEGSEFAKRSKYVTWRAAVETSRSVQQLAFQVREFDSHIKWDEIENTNILSTMSKESKKPIRSFKKVVIRRKSIEGTVIKYLLDFGKRRFIPDIVVRHGSMVEESSSERKKYWLEEAYVPLHLLKVFEEKRIDRKSNKMSSVKLLESGRASKKSSTKRGFSYLFLKAERSENYQCGHCNKDVLIREAVSCQYCEGFFHKRHVRRSTGSVAAECTYMCHKCKDVKPLKLVTKKVKSWIQEGKKSSTVARAVRSNITKKTCKNKRTAQSQNKGNIPVAVPLRRSARKLKCVSLPIKKPVGRKKGRPVKSKKVVSKKPEKGGVWQKKRTQVYHSYWLSGLLLSSKPNDERVKHFRSKKLLSPSEQASTILDQPKCGLCCEPEFTYSLVYVGCEACGDWFHGDAFGLNVQNINNLIGFKCHKCLNRTSPVCPHLHDMRSEEPQLGETTVNSAIEYSGEVSGVSTLPNEVFEKHKFHSDDESKNLFPVAESCDKEKQLGPTPNLNQKIMSEAENGHLPLSENQEKEEFLNSKEMDPRSDELLDADENISLVDKTNTTMSARGETESPLSKFDVDVIDTESVLLAHNNVKNGLVKTMAITESLVNKPLIHSSESHPQAILASGELLDGEEKMA